jgi:hypothetical protein
MKKILFAPSAAILTFVVSILPAIARPAPDPSPKACNTYGYISNVTSSSLRISGGVKCSVDQLIALGVQVKRNGQLVYQKGYSWSEQACSLRQCSAGYTASNPSGQQKFEIVVIARLAAPVAAGVGKNWIGSSYRLVDTYTFYK